MNVLRPGSAGSGSSSSSRRRNEKPQQAEQVQGPQHPVPPACVQADGTSNARAPALGQTAGAAGHAVAGVPAAPTLDHSPQAAQLQGRAFDEDDPFQSALQDSQCFHSTCDCRALVCTAQCTAAKQQMRALQGSKFA
eukprot:scaffold86466_cov19-Tisochrysis_lutea.AAC.1